MRKFTADYNHNNKEMTANFGNNKQYTANVPHHLNQADTYSKLVY